MGFAKNLAYVGGIGLLVAALSAGSKQYERVRENPFLLETMDSTNRGFYQYALGEMTETPFIDVTGDGNPDVVVLYKNGHAFFHETNYHPVGVSARMKRIHPNTPEAERLLNLRADFEFAYPTDTRKQ